MKIVTEYFQRLNEVLSKLDYQKIVDVMQVIEDAYNDSRSIYVFGNGGSGANASHFCEDLAKYVLDIGNGKRLKIFSLTDNTPFILALANDEGYEHIFSKQLQVYADAGDVVIGISGSGNSPNILTAIDYANANSMITIGITGFDGGKLYDMVGYNLHVPCDDMGMCEAVHLTLMHLITRGVVQRLSSLE
jgi:D-sedoheptulose 7-phosphate isomerase